MNHFYSRLDHSKSFNLMSTSQKSPCCFTGLIFVLQSGPAKIGTWKNYRYSLISLGIFTTSFTGGKKISRVNPSDTGGKTGGKNIPRLRLRNSVGNLSFKIDGDMRRETKEKTSDMVENSF